MPTLYPPYHARLARYASGCRIDTPARRSRRRLPSAHQARRPQRAEVSSRPARPRPVHAEIDPAAADRGSTSAADAGYRSRRAPLLDDLDDRERCVRWMIALVRGMAARGSGRGHLAEMIGQAAGQARPSGCSWRRWRPRSILLIVPPSTSASGQPMAFRPRRDLGGDRHHGSPGPTVSPPIARDVDHRLLQPGRVRLARAAAPCRRKRICRQEVAGCRNRTAARDRSARRLRPKHQHRGGNRAGADHQPGEMADIVGNRPASVGAFGVERDRPGSRGHYWPGSTCPINLRPAARPQASSAQKALLQSCAALPSSRSSAAGRRPRSASAVSSVMDAGRIDGPGAACRARRPRRFRPGSIADSCRWASAARLNGISRS